MADIPKPEPQEATIEDLTKGLAFERSIVLDTPNTYLDGKKVRYRSLRGREFRRITQRIQVGKDDLAGNYALALEACKVAILTPGFAERAEDMDHDVVLQIGQAIIDASKPEEEEVEDFSRAEKARSSS